MLLGSQELQSLKSVEDQYSFEVEPSMVGGETDYQQVDQDYACRDFMQNLNSIIF
jgi:hypothetical protein